MTTTEIVPYQTGYVPALSGSTSVAQLMHEELGGETISFDRIKIPLGGGAMFTMPEDHEPPMTREILGIIVDHHRANAFWYKAYTGGKQPPECSSQDAITGRGNRGMLPDGSQDAPGVHACEGCPWNEFGTALNEKGDIGKGKRCKNVYRVYLLPQGFLFPLLLTLPATSLADFRNFIGKRIVQKGLRPTDVVVRVGLRQQTGEGVPPFSVATWKVEGQLSPADAEAMAGYRENLRKVTRTLEITEDDMAA